MKLTKSQFKQIIKEETSAMNVALDVAGFIPGYGEIADVINALDYARKGEYLFSALSVLSVIPELGDIVGKGTKYAIKLAQAGKGGKAATKVAGAAPKAQKFINAAAHLKKAKMVLRNSQGLIDGVFEKAEEMDNEELKKYLPKIRQALNTFIGADELSQSLPETKKENTMKLTGDKLKELIREAMEDEIEDEIEEELLSAIKRLTKGVEGLDLSMDFLSAAMTGEHPLSIGVGQKTLGRHRGPRPAQMKEYLDEVIEEELRKIFKEKE